MPKPVQHIALIPARGGSKRLPGKNIQSFFGHPMLAYTIAAARNSQVFSHIIVSTDDPHIGQIAEWYGAEYLPRPAALATDTATLPDVGVHTLDVLAQRGVQSTAMCLLMPNCPLRTSADIREHMQLFETHQRDFQISVVTYGHLYPHWALQMDEHQRGSWLFGRQFLVQSQHLAASYCPTGAIWWVRVPPFLAQQAFYGDPYHLALIDNNRGIDIDEEEDMRQADILVRGLSAYPGGVSLEPITVPPFEAAAP